MSTFFSEEPDWYRGGEAFGQPTAIEPSRADMGSLRIAVALIERNPDERDRLAALIGTGVSTFASLEELSVRLTGTPVVAILGPSCSQEGVLASAGRLLQHHSELGAILVAHELSTALLQQALRAGVKDVLTDPLTTEQIYEAVERIAATLKVAPTSGFGHETATTDQFDGELGQVITVFSTKGGAGKSVIASNLAVVLAQRSTDRPVCLVDADLQFGDIAVMLKLAPQHTIVDAVAGLDRLDVPMLQNLLTTHPSSRLNVLAAPLEPAFADQIGAAEMVKIVEVLRRMCSYVVVDTPAYFNDVVLGLIEVSDEVLLVAGMDVPNIKNVKIGLQTLRLLNTPKEKLRLILNRANSKAKLDVSEVERTLQVHADALIPSDVVVPQAVNKGIPVVLASPRSSVTKAIEELADLFTVSDSAKRRRR
jgi:pilus assembly protein CpaE